MIAVDTNILIYAHRAEFPRHAAAARKLTALAAAPGPWGVPVFCIGEFVRVVTHRKVLSPPSTIDQASAFLRALTASPSFALLLAEPEYLGDFEAALRYARASGNLAFDAQIAALCERQGATLLTEDRDFQRFDLATIGLEG
jgi:hypothetical protein